MYVCFFVVFLFAFCFYVHVYVHISINDTISHKKTQNIDSLSTTPNNRQTVIISVPIPTSVTLVNPSIDIIKYQRNVCIIYVSSTKKLTKKEMKLKSSIAKVSLPNPLREKYTALRELVAKVKKNKKESKKKKEKKLETKTKKVKLYGKTGKKAKNHRVENQTLQCLVFLED